MNIARALFHDKTRIKREIRFKIYLDEFAIALQNTNKTFILLRRRRYLSSQFPYKTRVRCSFCFKGCKVFILVAFSISRIFECKTDFFIQILWCANLVYVRYYWPPAGTISLQNTTKTFFLLQGPSFAKTACVRNSTTEHDDNAHFASKPVMCLSYIRSLFLLTLE